MCIDPYYKYNLSILGSVKESVINFKNSKYHNFERKFKNLNSKYLHHLPNLKFPRIKNSFESYFNGFHKTQYYKSFIVVRCTIKNANDERSQKWIQIKMYLKFIQMDKLYETANNILKK